MKTSPLTLLSSATFAGGLTVNADLSSVYRLVHSYPTGAALAEYVGTLADITDAEHAVLASDDSARCVVASEASTLCGHCSGLDSFRPGAVSWGCTCGVSDSDFAAEYSFWAD